MQRRHAMPFGAELRPDGSTRFRLWAPGATRVALELGADAAVSRVAMTTSAHAAHAGWYEALVRCAPAGTRYAFLVDGRLTVPDPASRSNPDDVHGRSMVVDPGAFEWRDEAWQGRPWEEAVIYELHIGTFTPQGTFAAAAEKLDYLVALGVTALEIMPVADFPGRRNWGYDGVLPFAPDSAYGSVHDFKRLIEAAHARGLMVLLDVVYNHFGPEGNYLHAYAPQFFNPRHQTPWGAAINFDADGARVVRDFFIHNALYWIEEYGLDGLRLDAVHAIVDTSQPDFVTELCTAVRAGPGRTRHVHLVLENDLNETRYLERDPRGRPRQASAQWNDDIHHALHVLLTGEHDGYYADYAARPLWFLGRCLAEGFAFQGEVSGYRDDTARGAPSAALPATAFVSFVQTHDQVGNRAYGERIAQLGDPGLLRLAVACLLLAPSPPLLFMGEEFAAASPFQFFCDFGAELGAAVTQGRRAEFGKFARFRDHAQRDAIPDPNDPATFAASTLNWAETGQAPHAAWLALYRELLALRHRHLVPHLAGMRAGGSFALIDDGGLRVDWTLGDGASLHLLANFGGAGCAGVVRPAGDLVYASDPAADGALARGALAATSVVVLLEARV